MDAISRVLVIVVCGIFASVSNGEEERRGRVDVKIEAVTSIAITDDHFICATLDWWPTDKCVSLGQVWSQQFGFVQYHPSKCHQGIWGNEDKSWRIITRPSPVQSW